ncbi:metallophosphoesterase [Klebsiella pneumoniae]|nr:metallophosphoesterase family protein [Klebsiella pneumoniae]EME9699341.1 metallophosphoesterase family protein [Klebsiella pneumoniae]
MRIAALSDIHGNIGALDAVLADISCRNVDQIVNLGDICSGGLFPKQTLDKLIPLALKTIRGNHDRQIFDRPREDMTVSDRYAADQLTEVQIEWLTGLPSTLRLEEDVLMVHGTPDSDTAYFLETVDSSGLRMANLTEASSRAGDLDAQIILCGHTHTQRILSLADGRIVVNPGSVGQPAYSVGGARPHVSESGSPHARYAIIERKNGDWNVEFHAVTYDWNQAATDAASHGREDLAFILRTGRAIGI